MHAFRVDGIGRKMFCHILRNVGCDPIFTLPIYEMRRVGTTNHVNRVNATSLFLRYALENSLSTRALNANGDAGIFSFKRSGKPFRSGQFQSRVEGNLTLLPRGFDLRGGNGGRRRSGSLKRFSKDASGNKWSRRLKNDASGMFPML